MINSPEAFLLLSLPDASLVATGSRTETGVLNLECVSMPNPDSKNSQDRTVYLVLRLNGTETPIDPARVVRRSDAAGIRTYSLAGSQADPTQLTLTIKVPRSNNQLLDQLETFDNILEGYVLDFHDTSSSIPPTVAGQSTTVDVKSGNRDLRGHLVMINEATGEVVGEVEDRFRINEDPIMHEKGHENDPVIIEVEEESIRKSDANALQAFARIVPPDQRNWITSSANIVSHAISLTTNLLLTTITTASSLYISHSTPSPHHSNSNSPTPATSKSGSPAPPPLPPRALVFLTSEKTRKGLSTVHAMSGEAVKVSSKTIGLIDKMIRRAMGANSREKYFARGVPASTSSSTLQTPSGSSFSPRTPSPTPIAPPSYTAGVDRPSLPPRRTSSPVGPPLPYRSRTAPGYGAPPLPPRLKTKDHILISADLILSTIDNSTRRILDVGTENIGRVMGHKYGPEAAHSSLLVAGTARNVGLVYVDMRGIGRRALLKSVGKNFLKGRLASGKIPELHAPQASFNK